MTPWFVSVIQPTVTALAWPPCLPWASSPPTWPAGPAADWSRFRARFRPTALGQVSNVGMSVEDAAQSSYTSSYVVYFFFLFQASVWLLSPTRSTRRSGDLEELWQMQQPSTSCLFLLVLKTSCFGSTFLQKVHQKTRKSSRAMHWNSVI